MIMVYIWCGVGVEKGAVETDGMSRCRLPAQKRLISIWIDVGGDEAKILNTFFFAVVPEMI